MNGTVFALTAHNGGIFAGGLQHRRGRGRELHRALERLGLAASGQRRKQLGPRSNCAQRRTDRGGTVHHRRRAGFGLLGRWGCPCYPDCNNAGGLTIADFGCFQTQFVAGDPYADCNGTGGLTIADFACFQTKFVAGCP